MLLTKFIIDNVHVIVVVETGARRVNIRYNNFINKLVGCWYFLNFATTSHNLERNMNNEEHICVLQEHACANTYKARN